MKISHIEIQSYLQFKDFSLDLTYPKGHEKEGQPLDKVCFIGQSGTGKTSLLNLIKTIITDGSHIGKFAHESMHKVIADIVLGNNKANGRITIENGNVKSEFIQKFNKNKLIPPKIEVEYFQFLNSQYQNQNILVSFPAEMNTNLQSIFKPKTERGIMVSSNETDIPSSLNENSLKYFDFDQSNIESVWNIILDDIQKYKVAQLGFNNELSNRLNSKAIEIETFLKDFQAWKAKNPNPLKELADKLNPMLNRFFLEIKPEFDFKTADDLRFIQVYQKDGNQEITNSGWSTGTKQLIMTATPLLKLNTDKSVILIDEPERSFYPDIQKDLMGFYRHLAPKAQFFVATHSPIIAASFDPWEIIELKFNEKGNITQELYFQGEHHVDNYRVHPKYLRWDAILTQLFDLEQDGMPDRQTKLQELAEMDVQLRKMKKANGKANQAEVNALWKRFKETAVLLDWKIQDYYEEN